MLQRRRENKWTAKRRRRFCRCHSFKCGHSGNEGSHRRCWLLSKRVSTDLFDIWQTKYSVNWMNCPFSCIQTNLFSFFAADTRYNRAAGPSFVLIVEHTNTTRRPLYLAMKTIYLRHGVGHFHRSKSANALRNEFQWELIHRPPHEGITTWKPIRKRPMEPDKNSSNTWRNIRWKCRLFKLFKSLYGANEKTSTKVNN